MQMAVLAERPVADLEVLGLAEVVVPAVAGCGGHCLWEALAVERPPQLNVRAVAAINIEHEHLESAAGQSNPATPETRRPA
jgi:hypothetical protein